MTFRQIGVPSKQEGTTFQSLQPSYVRRCNTPFLHKIITVMIIAFGEITAANFVCVLCSTRSYIGPEMFTNKRRLFTRFIFKWRTVSCEALPIRLVYDFGDMRWLKLLLFCRIPPNGIRCQFKFVSLHICRFDQIRIDWLTESVEVKTRLKGIRLSMDCIVIVVCRKTWSISYDFIWWNVEMGRMQKDKCLSSAKHCKITLSADDLCWEHFQVHPITLIRAYSASLHADNYYLLFILLKCRISFIA